MQLSRRAFLGAARKGDREVLRPPWALPESEFLSRCTRCSDCIAACPTQLLQKGQGGYPEADFNLTRHTSNCTFCGDCLRACPSHALAAGPDQLPWHLEAIFTERCLAQQGVVCYTCRESCDNSAIRPAYRHDGIPQPQLEAAHCTGCGLCLHDCPTHAIEMRRAPQDSHLLRGTA